MAAAAATRGGGRRRQAYAGGGGGGGGDDDAIAALTAGFGALGVERVRLAPAAEAEVERRVRARIDDECGKRIAALELERGATAEAERRGATTLGMHVLSRLTAKAATTGRRELRSDAALLAVIKELDYEGKTATGAAAGFDDDTIRGAFGAPDVHVASEAHEEAALRLFGRGAGNVLGLLFGGVHADADASAPLLAELVVEGDNHVHRAGTVQRTLFNLTTAHTAAIAAATLHMAMELASSDDTAGSREHVALYAERILRATRTEDAALGVLLTAFLRIPQWQRRASGSDNAFADAYLAAFVDPDAAVRHDAFYGVVYTAALLNYSVSAARSILLEHAFTIMKGTTTAGKSATYGQVLRALRAQKTPPEPRVVRAFAYEPLRVGERPGDPRAIGPWYERVLDTKAPTATPLRGSELAYTSPAAHALALYDNYTRVWTYEAEAEASGEDEEEERPAQMQHGEARLSGGADVAGETANARTAVERHMSSVCVDYGLGYRAPNVCDTDELVLELASFTTALRLAHGTHLLAEPHDIVWDFGGGVAIPALPVHIPIARGAAAAAASAAAGAASAAAAAGEPAVPPMAVVEQHYALARDALSLRAVWLRHAIYAVKTVWPTASGGDTKPADSAAQLQQLLSPSTDMPFHAMLHWLVSGAAPYAPRRAITPLSYADLVSAATTPAYTDLVGALAVRGATAAALKALPGASATLRRAVLATGPEWKFDKDTDDAALRRAAGMIQAARNVLPVMLLSAPPPAVQRRGAAATARKADDFDHPAALRERYAVAWRAVERERTPANVFRAFGELTGMPGGIELGAARRIYMPPLLQPETDVYAAALRDTQVPDLPFATFDRMVRSLPFVYHAVGMEMYSRIPDITGGGPGAWLLLLYALHTASTLLAMHVRADKLDSRESVLYYAAAYVPVSLYGTTFAKALASMLAELKTMLSRSDMGPLLEADAQFMRDNVYAVAPFRGIGDGPLHQLARAYAAILDTMALRLTLTPSAAPALAETAADGPALLGESGAAAVPQPGATGAVALAMDAPSASPVDHMALHESAAAAAPTIVGAAETAPSGASAAAAVVVETAPSGASAPVIVVVAAASAPPVAIYDTVAHTRIAALAADTDAVVRHCGVIEGALRTLAAATTPSTALLHNRAHIARSVVLPGGTPVRTRWWHNISAAAAAIAERAHCSDSAASLRAASDALDALDTE